MEKWMVRRVGGRSCLGIVEEQGLRETSEGVEMTVLNPSIQAGKEIGQGKGDFDIGKEGCVS